MGEHMRKWTFDICRLAEIEVQSFAAEVELDNINGTY